MLNSPRPSVIGTAGRISFEATATRRPNLRRSMSSGGCTFSIIWILTPHNLTCICWTRQALVHGGAGAGLNKLLDTVLVICFPFLNTRSHYHNTMIRATNLLRWKLIHGDMGDTLQGSQNNARKKSTG